MALEAMVDPKAGGLGGSRPKPRPKKPGLLGQAAGAARRPMPQRPQPGPPSFGAMPGFPQMQRSPMPQMPRPMPPPSLPSMPGPAQPGPAEAPLPQTGGPEPKPEGMGLTLPGGPGQYGGYNPQSRPGGSVFGNPWGGFGG